MTQTIEQAREALEKAQAEAAEHARQVAELQAQREAEKRERVAAWAHDVIDQYPDAIAAATRATAERETAFWHAAINGTYEEARAAWLAWGAAASTEYQTTATLANAASATGVTSVNGRSIPMPKRGRFLDSFGEAIDTALKREYAQQSKANADRVAATIADIREGRA